MSLPDVQIDWKEYFLEFDRQHGGNPVRYKTLLLYQDGWRYSSNDHAGPEYPPPTDPVFLQKLISRYWWIHSARLKRDAVELEEFIQRMKNLQATKSLPLLQIRSVQDADGNWSRDTVPLNMDALQQNLALLQEELSRAEQEYQRVATADVQQPA